MEVSSLRRIVVIAVLAVLAVGALGTPALIGAPVAAQEATTSAAPSPSPARPGRPTSIAVVGDSITQATGTGALGQETPQNSWATGSGVDSVANRLGIPAGQRYNLAANGARMTHFVGQIRDGKSGGSGNVAPLPADAGLVLVEFGGNDLCKDSLSEMTAVATYRTQFRAGLLQVAAQAPTALIQVLSVPDIYNLWYIRGARQDPVHHPEPESSQASGINGARFYWDGLTSLGVKFPCQSLLASPGSYAEEDIARRLAVRQRNKELNAVLAQECAAVLRCRFDGNHLFDLTSNRQTPPDGPLWPQPFWNFTDLDISRNTTSGCPIPGLVGGGCGDHFHPSKAGQEKIARVASEHGYDFADATYPVASGTILPSGRPGGLHHGRATVRFAGSDDRGLRGQEVRVHHPDGSVTPWSQHLGVAPDRTVDRVGRSYVEVRSLDINGNLSAGTLVVVDVVAPLVPSAPGAPSLTADASGLRVAWNAPADDGGGTIARYDVTTLAGPSSTPTGSPLPVAGALSASAPPPPPGTLVRYSVAAVNSTGAGPGSAPSIATVAPFGSLAAFVDRQYRDFAGRPPNSFERAVEIDRLLTGADTPATLVDRLRGSTWFGAAYGPAIRLYRAYFLRLPDPSGLDYWAARRREGRTLQKMSQQFAVSSEFVRRYGPLSDAAFIDAIYNNVFFRDPDPSGRDFFLRRLAAGWSRGEVVLQFSESSEYKRQMTPLVDVIELSRGLMGRAPNQIDTEFRLLDHANGGAAGVFAGIVASGGYRLRVFA